MRGFAIAIKFKNFKKNLEQDTNFPVFKKISDRFLLDSSEF